MRQIGLIGLAWCLGCGSGDAPAFDAAPSDAGVRIDAGIGGETVRDRARDLAQHLIGEGNFMIGLGNDNAGPYDHGIPIDLHYAYLVGYGDQGGWPTWNADGNYPKLFAETADSHGVTPMFIYYQLALELETGNDAVLADATRMHQYLADQRLLFARMAETGLPVAIVYEPDFFGYLMQRDAAGTGPDQIVARIHHDDVPECAGLPETAAGLTRCVVTIARSEYPGVRIGFAASAWGAWWDPLDPDADIEASAVAVAAFLREVGAVDTDFVAVETLDRDAGFWETDGGGSTCSVTGGPRGAVYWDETNQTLPNFDQHLRWVGALTDELRLPALWWQTPLGVPSDTCGGTDEHYRDNRVHYFFDHIDELVDAGGAGVTFGTGAGGQTHVGTDGDQLKNAATAYAGAPVAL